MKVAYVKNLMIQGLSTITNNENEQSDDSGKIVKLWQDYEEQNIYSKTLNKAKSSSIYALYNEYESDDSEDFKVTVGVEVTKSKNAIVIENERYLVFKKQGELPEIVTELWQEILEYFENNNEYERTYKVDFEKYSKENEIEIYIAIK